MVNYLLDDIYGLDTKEQLKKAMEDLEKLFFVWQEATELAESDAVVEVQEELQTKGFRYSGLRIKEK